MDQLDTFADLGSVPKHRPLKNNPFLDRLRKAVAYDFVCISGLDIDGFRLGSGKSLDSNAPPAFIEAYFADELFKTDPVLLATLTADCVVIESAVYAETPPSPRLSYLAGLFGFRNRTVFPLRRGDLVYASVCFTRTEPFDQDEIDFLGKIVPAVYRSVTGPLLERFSTPTLRITSGEVKCLEFASQGFTSEHVAEKSGYSPDTVNSYIKNATTKLGAQNRTHAVAEAIRRNLIA